MLIRYSVQGGSKLLLILMADYPDRLRFVNYTDTSSIAGRLEIYLNGVWDTIICDNGFGADEATLACQQLGYQAYSI